MKFAQKSQVQRGKFVLSAILLIISLSMFGTGCIRQSMDDPEVSVNGPAILLLTRLDGDLPQLSAYIYNMDITSVYLTAGRYYAEMLHPDGTVTAFPAFDLMENNQSELRFDPSGISSHPLAGSAPGQEVETLVRFLLAVDNVRLTYYEIASGGFEYPLFDPDVFVSGEDANRLLQSFKNLGDEAETINAARNFIERGISSADAAGKAGLARIAGGPLDIIKGIAHFFGIIEDEEEIARQNLIKILSAEKTTIEEEELFEIITQANPGIASSLPEFIQKLENNEVKGPAQIRQELVQNSPVFYGIWHDLNPKSNRPDGEIIHRVGAEAVNRGAELNITIIKEVLNSVFPGMDQGFEYADKVDKFAEFVRDLYQDPTDVIGGVVRGQIEERVKERIKEQFMDMFPDIEEGDAETLTNNVVDQMNQVIKTQEEMRQELIAEDEQKNGQKTDSIDKPQQGGSEIVLHAETFTENGQTYRFFEGRGSRCSEAEGTFIYRWSLDLMEEVGRDLVMGTVKFHNCPQGGRVLYRVEGFVDDEGLFSMVGTRKDGGGDLFDNSPSSATFSYDPVNGVLTPNYAP